MKTCKLCLFSLPFVILFSCQPAKNKVPDKTPNSKIKNAATKTFQVRQEFSVNVPKDARKIRIWLTLPQETATQKIIDFKMDTDHSMKKVTDARNNKFAYFEIDSPTAGQLKFVETFKIIRSESKSNLDPKKSRPLSAAEQTKFAKYVKPNKHVVIDDKIKKLAMKIVGNEKNPVVAARKIYDWVLKNTEYWVKQPGALTASKVGSTTHCLSTGTGNCTDIHSLFASIARAAGIPTQIVYGSLFKPELDGKDKDASYHCWIEFYAPEIGWAPLDVAVADIFEKKFAVNDKNRMLVTLTTATGYAGPDAKLVDYYFGNLDARRVTWSRGRDLILEPKQVGGPVNAIPKAYIEVDGKELSSSAWTRKLTFKEVTN